MPDVAVTARALDDALEDRRPAVEEFGRYYHGQHKIAFATSKWRETFGSLFNELSDNWCQLVIDASVERLKVEGFRFGPEGDAADDEAWQLWQANYLDADSPLGHRESCTSGISYVLILPGDDPETPRITVESPLQVITRTAPDDRRRRDAGWKKWIDDDGKTERAMLYTPEAFLGFTKAKDRKNWTADSSVVNPIGIVPVVPMLNNPTILGAGVSDLNVVVSLQDAINKLLADMLVNSEYVAFPQRFATGLEIPTDPGTGRPLEREQFLSSVGRMWVAEDSDVEFGQLTESDGRNLIAQMEALVQHIAAQTRTPPHYLLGQSGAFPSGESLKSTETGLVAKTHGKQLTFGETWEESMRIAFAYRGDIARAKAVAAETIWADPESRTEGELVDALVKMRTLGVPLEALWERWGVSPQTRKRWLKQRGLPDPLADDDKNVDDEDQEDAPPTGDADETNPGVRRDA